MGINNIKHIIKKILIFFNLYKEKDLFFTRDVFRSRNYKIGEFSYGAPNIFFDGEASLSIGKYCSIGQNVNIFLGGNHRVDWVTTYPFTNLPTFFPEANQISGHPSSNGDIIIGNDVWIGYGATILSGVSISDGAVIAAFSIVTKNIGPYEVWGGNPAKLLYKRFPEHIINELLKMQWWNWDREMIVNNIKILCSENAEQLIKTQQFNHAFN